MYSKPTGGRLTFTRPRTGDNPISYGDPSKYANATGTPKQRLVEMPRLRPAISPLRSGAKKSVLKGVKSANPFRKFKNKLLT